MRSLQDKRANYLFDKPNERYAIAAFNLGMYTEGKLYKRQIRNGLLDLLSKVGGFAEAALFIGFLFNLYFGSQLAQVKAVNAYRYLRNSVW